MLEGLHTMSNQQKPTIVFDLDGTLADTAQDLINAVNATTAAHGLDPVPLSVLRQAAGDGLVALVRLSFQHHKRSIEDELLSNLAILSIEEYNRNISVHSTFFPGAISCVEQFVAADWKVAICSNKPENMAKKLVEDLGATNLFGTITGGDSYSVRKPDPQHLLSTIKDIGGVASNAIMIGDTHTDIHTAQNANIPVVAVDFGYSKEHVSTFNPNKVISNFDNLFDISSELLGI